MNNILGLMQMYQQLRQNPVQVLSQKYNIPANMNDPQQIIQHLLNSGQVSQAQINQLMQLRNNPQIQQLFNMK